MNMLQFSLSGGGSFREVARILEGLTFAVATRTVPGLAHSVYDLLWHIELSQRLLLEHATGGSVDWNAVPRWWPHEVTEEEFARVMRDVQVGLAQAQLLAEDPSDRARDALTDLAVHNAYHWGQVVMLRQLLNNWSAE